MNAAVDTAFAEPMDAAHPVPGIAERMDRLPLTRLHVFIAIVGTFGFAFDLMEVALGNVLSAVFSAEPYSVPVGQLSWLLSAMYLGAIIGAPLAGFLADVAGRRNVLIGVLLILAVTSLAAAMSTDFTSLVIARALSGIALGAYPPLLISLLTDLMPPRQRGKIIMIVAGLAALGPVGVTFLVRWLTPIMPLGLEGWRWAFLIGTLGALVFAMALRLVPESPRWLAARGRRDEAQRALQRFDVSSAVSSRTGDIVPVTASPSAEPDTVHPRRRFAVFAGLYFLAPWAVVAFPLLMGAVLVGKGFSLNDSLFYVGITMFGPVIGSIVAAWFIDRLDRRLALSIFGALMIAAGAGFAASSEPLWLMVAGLTFSIVSLLYVPTLTIYTAESFATAFRARASTFTWAINRIASALAPLILLPLLAGSGVWAMFTLIAVALVLGIVLVLAFGDRGRPGEAVD